MQRASTACGQPEAEHTSGLVAYLEDEPVGWVAVEPRIAHPEAVHAEGAVDWEARTRTTMASRR